ncbi:hypothetical protein [uncultured Dysgonomonas sp.]|uniref:Uncharacterized protein n=1 Tax=uncultured Dysgonomonas sp. TaxID=206096 RepID=A0A212K7E9_9BACT|nr:hypothetical protein [uncultured Dysgonomonas sp.]SBW07572.1 conserved exported hypothetical protein [uncultured Dysgonomonas sp.]
MKLQNSYILLACILLFSLQACVDKDYDWGNMDKSGVISIPPIPLGDIDTIYIKGLPQLNESWGIPIPDGSIALSDTIRGLFDDNAIRKFFYEGNETVEISAKIDIYVAIKGVSLDVYFNIIDTGKRRINKVLIPKQTLITGKQQDFSVKITSEYMQYMESASDLQLVIVLSSKDAILWLGDKDYLYIWGAIVKTGGFYYEL